MRAVYTISANTTVNTIVGEIYDVYDPVAAATDTERRDKAAQALRDLNPALPSDESPVTSATGSGWLWLPSIPRTPWRIPPETSTLRTALEGLGLRNVNQLANVSFGWLKSKVGGSFTDAQIKRIRNISRLVRVSGLDRTRAVALYDDATNPIQDPFELAAADQEVLQEQLEDAGLPTAALNLHAAFLLTQRARRITSRRTARRFQARPIPLRPEAVEAEAAWWQQESRSSLRTQAQRDSAVALSWLYEVQTSILKGNVALAKGQHEDAYRYLRRTWKIIGQAAVGHGIVTASSVEADGPSLQTVLEVVWRRLDMLDDLDVDSARDRFGISIQDRDDGLKGFGLNDLQSAKKTTVMNALDNQPIHATGTVGAVALDRALAEKTKTNLSAVTGLTGGIGTPTNAGRARDFGDNDQQQLRQNVRASTVTAIRTNGTLGSTWGAVEAAINLRHIRQSVGQSLDVGGVTPTAASVLTTGVVNAYPANLTSNMSPFDRFVAYKPSRQATSPRFYAPINANFPTRYKTDVLSVLLDDPAGAGWSYTSSDFADPARFAMILPQLVSRHIPMALSKTLMALGVPEAAMAMCANTSSQKVLDNASSPLVDAISEGTASMAIVTEANCDDAVSFEYLLYLNCWRGDTAYKAGQYQTAKYYYEMVLALGRVCTDTELFVSDMPVVYEDLQDRITEQVDNHVFSPRLNMFDYVMEDTANNTFRYVFGDVYRYSISTLATQTLRVAVGNTNIGVKFYDVPFVADPLDELDDGDDRDLDTPAGVPVEEVGRPTFDLPEDPPLDFTKALPPITGVAKFGTFVGNANNATVQGYLLHAFTHLTQLELGLNWLGLDSDMIPPWKYEYLLQQARYYAEKADALQQRSLSILTAAELEEAGEMVAEAAVEAALQAVEVAKAQEDLAQSQVEAAKEAKQAAQSMKDNTKGDALWSLGVGLAATVAGVAGAAFTGGASFSILAVATAQTAGGAAAVGGLASTALSINNAFEGKEAASHQLDVASANLDVAKAQKALAVQQTAQATLEAENAQEYLAYLQNQQLTAETYYNMLEIIEPIAESYLLMANRLAWLAERALQLESRKNSSYIRMSYSNPAVVEYRFTGAATLLAHLDVLEHSRLTSTTDRYQLVRTTFSLLSHLPGSLINLQLTGRTFFHLTQQQLDLRFPGLYLHSIRRIEIEFDGLMPAEGVHAVLRTAGLSRVRVPNNEFYIPENDAVEEDWAYREDDGYELGGENPPSFVMKSLYPTNYTQVLSEYRLSQDGAVLSPPTGVLDTFEHLGPDMMLLLDIPRSGNSFPFLNIADARVVLYFSAQYNAELAERQQEILADPEGDKLSRAVALTASTAFAEQLSRWQTTPTDPTFRDVRLLRFEITTNDLPANTKERVVENFTVAVLVVDGRTLTLRFAASGAPFGAVGDTTLEDEHDLPDGLLFSAVGDTEEIIVDGVTLHAPREGDNPQFDAMVTQMQTDEADVLGVWCLKILPEDNPDLRLRDDDGDLVSISSGKLQLVDGGTATYTGGNWRHAEVTTRVKLVAGTLSVILRSGGSHAVSADLEWDSGISSMTVSLTQGTVTDSVVSTTYIPDAVTEVALRVVGTDATLLLDGVEVLTLDFSSNYPSSTPSGGSVAFVFDTSSSTTAEVYDVRVTRLRYDSAALQEVVSDSFKTDATAWTLSSPGATRVSSTHNLLDLSWLQDVLLQVDYTYRIDFLEQA